jgi:transposase
VVNLIKRFEATGSVKDLARPGRPRSICTEEKKQVVEAAFRSTNVNQASGSP